jgi:hypothetical protein
VKPGWLANAHLFFCIPGVYIFYMCAGLLPRCAARSRAPLGSSVGCAQNTSTCDPVFELRSRISAVATAVNYRNSLNFAVRFDAEYVCLSWVCSHGTRSYCCCAMSSMSMRRSKRVKGSDRVIISRSLDPWKSCRVSSSSAYSSCSSFAQARALLKLELCSSSSSLGGTNTQRFAQC